MGDDRYRRRPQVLEGGDCFQRENGHVLCLHLLGQLHMNKIRLLAGGGVCSIADVSVSFLFVHSLWKGDMDDVLRCMAEEWGL